MAQEASKLWKDLTQWLEEASKVLGKEAGDLTLKGRLKLEIFELNRTLKEACAKLGTEVYEQVFVKKKKNWQNVKQIVTTVDRIKNLKLKLQHKVTEYKRVGKSYEE